MTTTLSQPPPSEQAFRVEQRGIEYVPEGERWATPRDLFGMWAGASVSFEYLVYGAVLMTFGFTFGQAVLLILVGNLSYLLLGVCSLQGPEAGTTTFTINRAGFGPNGIAPDRPVQLGHAGRLRDRRADPDRVWRHRPGRQGRLSRRAPR